MKICGFDIKIRLAEMENDEWGDCDVLVQEIRINQKLDPRQRFYALVHELGHALAPTFTDTEIGHALWDVLSANIAQTLWDSGLIDQVRLQQLFNEE